MILKRVLAARFFLLFLLAPVFGEQYLVLLGEDKGHSSCVVKLLVIAEHSSVSLQTELSLPRIEQEPKETISSCFSTDHPFSAGATYASGDSVFRVITTSKVPEPTKETAAWVPLQSVLWGELKPNIHISLQTLPSIVDDWQDLLAKNLNLESKIQNPPCKSVILRYGPLGSAEILLQKMDDQKSFGPIGGADPSELTGVEVLRDRGPRALRVDRDCHIFLYRAMHDGSIGPHPLPQFGWFALSDLESSELVSGDIKSIAENSAFISYLKLNSLDGSCNSLGCYPHLAAVEKGTDEFIWKTVEIVLQALKSKDWTFKIAFSKLPQIGDKIPYVEFENTSPLDAAYARAYAKTVLLINSASNHTPGGAFKQGGEGAEENLCRRTSLGYILSSHPELYPISSTADGPLNAIITQGVTILRSEEYEFYSLHNFRNISVCSIAANDKDFKNQLSAISPYDTIKERIALQFQVAEATRAKVLVVSDFGLGQNDIHSLHRLARLYDEALLDYRGEIETVVFAFPDRSARISFEHFLRYRKYTPT